MNESSSWKEKLGTVIALISIVFSGMGMYISLETEILWIPIGFGAVGAVLAFCSQRLGYAGRMKNIAYALAIVSVAFGAMDLMEELIASASD